MTSTATSPTEAARPAKKRRRRRRPPIKARVVWVDDDPNVVSAVSRRFRRRGIEVVPASDGMQGYWLTLTSKPDVVVTDLRMPRWEGRDLLECLLANSETAAAPVVVLSGYVTPEERARLRKMGVAAVLEKPAEWRELLGTIRGLLPQAKSEPDPIEA